MLVLRREFVLCVLFLGTIGLVVSGQTPQLPKTEAKKFAIIQNIAFRKYTTVPLVLSQETSFAYVNMIIDNQKCTLLLDTGSAVSYIDLNFAKANSIIVVDIKDHFSGFFDGTKTPLMLAVPRTAQIAEFKIPQLLPWFAFDMTKLIQIGKPKDIPEMHGILGLDVLKQYSAIIDLPNSQMLLIDPMDFHDQLQGIWEGTSIVGGDIKNNANHLALTIDKNKASFNLNTVEHTFTLDFRNKLKCMMWTRDKTSFRVAYALSDDGNSLTIAGPVLSGNDEKAVAKNLDPPKDATYSLIKFTRKKTMKPPDPISP